ncbi:MAG: hypothetical protein NWF05_00600 [Candidatus Bathyarchaeota archaeon]|nr:hypothetical protein [Candidatus Bathyarchaeota archaeon]
MKLPLFVQQEVDQIYAQMSPERIRVGVLLSQQEAYNTKAVLLQGSVVSVVSLDEMDEQTVSTWFLNLPTTVETTASATYFYLKDRMGTEILVKYPADLDVCAGDSVTLAGMFSAHGITVQSKGLLWTKQEEVVNALGEPFVGAVTVENHTKQKLDYIRQNP